MPLNVAVVGLGVGAAHARALARIPECVVRSVYDLQRERMTTVIAEIGQGHAAESYESILADPQIGVVSLATFDDAHAAQTIAALHAKKHVFCEKPLCRTMEEARAIKSSWRESGKYLSSNLVLRAAPLWRWLKEAIEADELGTVYAFDGDYLYGRLTKITEGWRKAVDDYSVMLGGGVHLIDLMLWLTGQRPTHVSAVGNRIASRGTEFRYDDFRAATYSFESGLIARITANFGCVHRHQHVVRVFGTKGTFIYDDQGPRLHRTRGESDRPIVLNFSPVPATKGELLAPFIDAIQGGRTLSPDTQHELDLIAVCIAADRAVGQGNSEVEYV